MLRKILESLNFQGFFYGSTINEDQHPSWLTMETILHIIVDAGNHSKTTGGVERI